MDLNDYQSRVSRGPAYPGAKHHTPNTINYTVIGLVGEASVLAAVWRTAIRDNDMVPAKERLRYDIGNVLYAVARLTHELGMSLDDVAQANIDRLHERKSKAETRVPQD